MQENFTIKELRVAQVIAETREAKTFVLEYCDHSKPVYQPGQFLTLVFYTAYGEKRRSYSISSAPALNEPLSITVKKVDNGEFSRWLISHVKAGDILYSSGINGFFRLPEEPAKTLQYFFIAAGSGITPCFSLLKTILANYDSEVVLIYSNKSREDTIFYAQLKQLEQRYQGRFTSRFLFSNVFDVNLSRLSNWLLQKLLNELLVTDMRKVLFYVCGPFDYMRTVHITLLGLVPASQVLKENFNTNPPLVVAKPPDTKAHNVTIHINGSGYTLQVQYPASILSAAKHNKIALPYSCEAGRCGSCAATCTRGKIWMAYNEVLTDDEVEKGRVLVCQSFPVGGDVEIVF